MIVADRAARKALAAYLQTALGLSADACQADWFPATMALPRPVAIAVHNAGTVARTDEQAAPVLVALTPGAGVTATATYRRGQYEVPLAVDVWASLQTDRDAYAQAVEAALHQPVTIAGVPQTNAAEGLLLPTLAGDYLDASADFLFEAYEEVVTPQAIDREEWRVVFQGRARLDRLVQLTITRQAYLTLLATVDPRALTPSAPPARTFTVF